MKQWSSCASAASEELRRSACEWSEVWHQMYTASMRQLCVDFALISTTRRLCNGAVNLPFSLRIVMRLFQALRLFYSRAFRSPCFFECTVGPCPFVAFFFFLTGCFFFFPPFKKLPAFGFPPFFFAHKRLLWASFSSLSRWTSKVFFFFFAGAVKDAALFFFRWFSLCLLESEEAFDLAMLGPNSVFWVVLALCLFAFLFLFL